MKKKKHRCLTKQLATNTLLQYPVQFTVSNFKILFPCHINRFTYYKKGNFMVPYVLRYFATESFKATHLQAVFKLLYSFLISVQHVCLKQSLHE